MEVRLKPNPSLGIFETLLVVRGEPVGREAHLARLETSLEAVYGTSLPAQARQLVAEHAEGLELGRVRLTFAPGKGIEVESGEIDRSLHFPEQATPLSSYTLSEGLGCHKWADRRAIPTSVPGKVTLLVDGDGILEADRANVFAVRRGTVFTPPLDGRILPGVTRATVMELGRAEGIEVVEDALSLSELCESEEVFLTNSIRGIEPVGSIDGFPLREEKPLTQRLENALRGRWESEATAPRRPLRTSV